MSTDRPREGLAGAVLRTVVLVLGSDFIDVLAIAWRLGKRILAFKAHDGMYEVLDYESCLELHEARGKKAVLHKHQRVRYRQDNIIAYQDKAWGDGDIFADYKCSPGVAVDRYREGHRWRVLISLRGTRKRGDVDEFHIERTIIDGFTQDVESFQTEIDHTTRKLTLSLLFPKSRPPRQVTLIEQNATRTMVLGPETRQTLPDGRIQVTWRTDKARLFEAYILSWEW